MSEYIKLKLSRDPEKAHGGTNRRAFSTPLEYATDSHRSDAIEFLLELKMEPLIDFRNMWYFHALFAYKDLTKMVPDPYIAIFASSFDFLLKSTGLYLRLHGGLSRELEMSDEESDVEVYEESKEGDTVWVHLPWTNGILFFFALRRYGQKHGYSTYSTDWLPSLFRQPITAPTNYDLPYTEPLYESNFGLSSESARGKLRALVIFPCLELWRKSNRKAAKVRVKNIRNGISTGLAKYMIEPPLTLDEAYFSSLPTEVLEGRNESQVVSTEHESAMLMVPQQWIWRCDLYLLTAFTARKFLRRFDEATARGVAYEADRMSEPEDLDSFTCPGI
ncbi:hypothetical protein F5Y14DRAFT_321524 [Nemania sp. NC0429]|nr:hypothetical protein F5Y14DRAFT_321524 [Nemania sp. NC0429]